MLNTSANLRLVRASQKRHDAFQPRIINPLVVRVLHHANPQALSPQKSQIHLSNTPIEISRPLIGSETVNIHCPHCGQCVAVHVNSQSAMLAFYLGNFGLTMVSAFVAYLFFGQPEFSAGAAAITLCTILLLESFCAVNHHAVLSLAEPDAPATHTVSHSAKF